MLSLFSKDTAEKLSIIKEPFAAEHITSVCTHLYKGFGGEWKARGYVEFKHGNTEGKQVFEDTTYEGVLFQIQAFIQTLK